MIRAATLLAAFLAGTVAAAAQQAPGAAPVQSTIRSAPKAQGDLAMSKHCQGPIDVTSDNFEGNYDTKVGTYIGNVIVIRDQCRLRADKVIAEAVASKEINRLTAVGNVVFASASGTATGDNGVYDLDRKIVTLTGRKVVLVKGKDVMRGTTLVVDTSTGMAHLTAKGLPGNRVHSSFVPKSQPPDDGSDNPGKNPDN